MLLSNFRHRQQQRNADCLVACVKMVLDYLQIPARYEQLFRVLQTEPYGTPFGHLTHLESIGIAITLQRFGQLDDFEPIIESGLPVIVNVDTRGWNYWQGRGTDHAVLVVGLSQEDGVVYLNDPFFEQAPLSLSVDEFMIGWEEKRRQYAVIRLDAS